MNPPIKIFLFFFFIIIDVYATGESNNEDEKEDLAVLVAEAHDWAHYVGMIWRPKESKTKSDVSEVIPVALFPTPFPREMFNKAYGLQKAMDLLYFRAAQDYNFLVDTLTEPAKADPTIGAWLDALKEMHEEGNFNRQPVTMFMQRSDYMCHMGSNEVDGKEKYELKQIEVNNGAPAGIIGEQVTKFHERILMLANMDPEKHLPENAIASTVAKGLYEAWKIFNNPKAILLMVTTPLGNQHQFEKRYVEYELEKLSGGKMKTAYISISLCSKKLRLADDFSLMLDNNVVAVVFFRTTLLVSTKELSKNNVLEARKMIEQSTAIKCPSIEMILTSTKKFQQILARPGNVERFFPDPADADTVKAIRSTFAGLWGLEYNDEKTKAVIQDAIAHPDRYVLKPNREGGGHNIWGQEIADKLSMLPAEERTQYILMQRLKPFIAQNYFLRSSKDPEFGLVNSELSTYGVLGGNMKNGKVLHNESHGHVYRSKWVNVNEGGITVGTGVYDSPYLF